MKFNVVTLQATDYPYHRGFEEVSLTLTSALRELGHQAIEFHLPIYKDEEEFGGAKGIINILLNAPMLGSAKVILPRKDRPLPKRTILYNLEPITSPWIDSMGKLFEQAYSVWDYSLSGYHRWRDQWLSGIHRPPGRWSCWHVPVGSSPESLSRIVHAEHKDIDILFYGSHSERRKKLIAAIFERFLSAHKRPTLLWPPRPVFGEERDRLIGRSRIVLNLHHTEGNPFEVVRVMHLMSSGCLVLSETGEGIEEFRAGLLEATSDKKLVEMAYRWTHEDLESRKKVAESGKKIAESRKMVHFLRAPIEFEMQRA